MKKRPLSGLRVGIIASVIVAMLHIILIGGTLQQRWAIRKLDSDQQILEENLALLEEIDQEQLEQLQLELDQVNAEISDLQASFPELGAPFDLYHRITSITEASGVNLQAISRLNAESKDTPTGVIISEEYSIELGGELTSCIHFIEELEKAGQDTIRVLQTNIWTLEGLCRLDIQTNGISN
jgi:hypothetical protein